MQQSSEVAVKIQNLIDKQEITEILMRYCRAIDRLDADLLRSVFWPDAIDDHGSFQGDVEGLIAHFFPALEPQRTQHFIGNILIEMTGSDEAFCESYVTAHHTADGKYGPVEFKVGARYIDLFTKRDGNWRIAHRQLIIDHYRQDAGNGDFLSGIFAGARNRGGRFPDDPVYR